MRRFFGLFALLTLLGCGSDGIDRLSGDGCQPACQTPAIVDDADGQRVVLCVTPSHDPAECAELGEGSVVCPGGVLPTCGENGPPTCEGDAVPYCAR